MMSGTQPRIRKAARIEGKTLVFRDATPADARFILSLRTDQRKARHLSRTAPELDRQREWLKQYASRENEAYFIIEIRSGEPLGTVRLYDPQGESFCWGSWILKDGAPPHAAIESALMVYGYALDHLGFNAAHFDVRRGNERVWRFHERFGAQRTGETGDDYLYRIDRERIDTSRNRYRRYLPEPVKVKWEDR